METALEKHIMQIFKSPCKKPVRDHGAKVRFSGTTAAEAIPQPFFMVRRISAWKSSKTTFFTLFWKFQNNGMKWLTITGSHSYYGIVKNVMARIR